MSADVPAPMKAVADALPTGDGWVFELKWDGMRLLIRLHGGDVRAFSGNGIDVTVRFPELDELAAALSPVDLVVDAEAVAFDDDGRPSFGRLQRRMHVATRAEARRRRREVPVVLVVFDLLEVGGTSVVDLPWSKRREALEELVGDGPVWRLSSVHDDGEALFAAAATHGLEGVIAKRADSPYRPGARSSAWRKIKVRRRQELVVGGWAHGNGARSAELASLGVGHWIDGSLHFAGRVGSGLTVATAAELEELLVPLAREGCPFEPMPPPGARSGMHWVEPRVVVEVAFAEWTDDGRLRHPTYLGRRADVDPDRVVREP